MKFCIEKIEHLIITNILKIRNKKTMFFKKKFSFDNLLFIETIS